MANLRWNGFEEAPVGTEKERLGQTRSQAQASEQQMCYLNRNVARNGW